MDTSKVDDKNRIVLHSEIRKMLNAKPGSVIAFVRHGKVIGLVNMDELSISLRKEEKK